jgi:thymidylate kinase
MAIIILEGCDGVGKDTVAESISKDLGMRILRGSSFEISELGKDGMFDYMMKLLDSDNVILNRFFYSNIVYGKIFNYPMMDSEQYSKLLEKVNDKGVLVVNLVSSEDIIKDRLDKRGDDKVKSEHVSDIINSYSDEMKGFFKPEKLLIVSNEKESDIHFIKNMVKNLVKE